MKTQLNHKHDFVAHLVGHFADAWHSARSATKCSMKCATKCFALGSLVLLLLPQPLLACSACFGKSDSDLAKGMNMGIFALLGVVAVVLGGIASFFVYLGRRAGAQAASAQNLSDQSADKTAQ